MFKVPTLCRSLTLPALLLVVPAMAQDVRWVHSDYPFEVRVDTDKSSKSGTSLNLKDEQGEGKIYELAPNGVLASLPKGDYQFTFQRGGSMVGQGYEFVLKFQFYGPPSSRNEKNRALDSYQCTITSKIMGDKIAVSDPGTGTTSNGKIMVTVDTTPRDKKRTAYLLSFDEPRRKH